MKKMKSKLTALLMIACCSVACLGVVAVSQPKDENVVAKAATADELAAEFTNNGRFTVGKSLTHPANGEHEFVNGATLETLPDGYEGAVLKLYQSTAADGWDHIGFDFSGSQIFAVDVSSIVVRVFVENFQSASDEIRVSAGPNTRQYGVGKYDLSTWCDVPLSASTIADMTDENGYLTSVDFGIREKGGASHVYIDSVTITEASYTTYNLDGLTFRKWDASKNHIYLTPKGDWERPDDGNNGWTADFLSKNGKGIMFGKKQIATARFPGDMFIELGAAPAQGDVLTIVGTFYNKGCAVQYVVPESKFVWNGTTWEAYEGTVTPDPTPDPEPEKTVTELGALTVHPHSAGTTANKPNATQLYMSSAVELPFTSWQDYFNLESGGGWKLNGNTITPAQFISADGNLFVNLTNVNVQVGDVLSVSGTFVHASEEAKYIIEESAFEWDGTAWIPCIEYTDYEVGVLELVGAQTSASSVSLKRADGKAFDFAASTFNFRVESGTGICLNGKKIETCAFTTTENEVLVSLGASAQEGDILTVGGKFYNFSLAAQYVVEDSSFIYENGVWSAYDKGYAQIGVGKVDVLVDASLEKVIYFVSEDESLRLPVDNWEDEFTCVFGEGVTLNGEVVDGTKIRSIDHAVCVSLGVKAQTGDVLSISGKFVCEAQNALYFVTGATFKWDGETWSEFAEASVDLSVWKTEAKARVDGYSNLETYEEASQSKMAEIINKAKADIDACTSAIKLNKIVNDAKAAMDKLMEPDEEIKNEEIKNEEIKNEESSEEIRRGCGGIIDGAAITMLALGSALTVLLKKKEN